MANLNKTKLDASQCIVDAYDGVDESNRIQITNPIIIDAAQKTVDTFDAIHTSQKVSIVNSIEYEIQLNSDDGDSVISYHDTLIDGSLIVASAPPTEATTTGIACYKYSSCSLFSTITDNPVTPGYAIIEVSPNDAGDDWHPLSGNVIAGKNPDGTITSTTGLSQAFNFVARRIRVRVPAAGRPSSATVTYKLLLRS